MHKRVLRLPLAPEAPQEQEPRLVGDEGSHLGTEQLLCCPGTGGSSAGFSHEALQICGSSLFFVPFPSVQGVAGICLHAH